jgi:hypothetical protein
LIVEVGTRHRASSSLQKSAIINHQSSIINHQSSIINHQSSIINHQSSIINHQSKIKNQKSKIINQAPLHQSIPLAQRVPPSSHTNRRNPIGVKPIS